MSGEYKKLRNKELIEKRTVRGNRTPKPNKNRDSFYSLNRDYYNLNVQFF